MFFYRQGLNRTEIKKRGILIEKLPLAVAAASALVCRDISVSFAAEGAFLYLFVVVSSLITVLLLLLLFKVKTKR